MNTLNIIRNLGAAGIGLAFISVGVDHFIHPSWYEPIVPSILGDPRFWVLVSGFSKFYLVYFSLSQTRAWASVGGAWLPVVLYWANFGHVYNNIPLMENIRRYLARSKTPHTDCSDFLNNLIGKLHLSR